MGPLFFISALVAYTSISCVEGQSECNLPMRGKGLCISINECGPLRALQKKQKKTAIDRYILQRSVRCGLGGAGQVCCPYDCFTFEGQLGRCIPAGSCPSIVPLFKEPIPEETRSYLLNTRCEGPHEYSVCCGQTVNLEVKPLKRQDCVTSAAPPDPRTECCGVDSSAGNRIYGGNATNIDQYPWLAIIEYVNTLTGAKKLMCGGALISRKYVLTAAHCIDVDILRFERPQRVRLGEYDTAHEGKDCVETDGGGIDCTDGTVVIPIERTIVHPDYNPYGPDMRSKQHDIALLRLLWLVKYTDFIRPICLPTSDLTLNPPSNLRLFAAGWGAIDGKTRRSNIKLHVDLPYHSFESCQPAYQTYQTLWEGQLCAGGEDGKDSCNGDSGGPLMHYKNNRTWEVTGIVSFGKVICGMEDVPGVYTNVFQYIPWMRSQIRP